jgi:hypothetical protein
MQLFLVPRRVVLESQPPSLHAPDRTLLILQCKMDAYHGGAHGAYCAHPAHPIIFLCLVQLLLGRLQHYFALYHGPNRKQHQMGGGVRAGNRVLPLLHATGSYIRRSQSTRSCTKHILKLPHTNLTTSPSPWAQSSELVHGGRGNGGQGSGREGMGGEM